MIQHARVRYSRARRTQTAFGVTLLGLLLASSISVEAAQFRTTNFVVKAESDRVARKVGEVAEHFRKELALEWTGREMPKWTKPCPITVKVGNIGAGGATTFSFDRGEVYGWRMNVQGTLERILDSVVPHEVCHTVFACHFRRPLPRWADEGAATLTEHEAEKSRQSRLLGQVIRTSRRIPLRELLSMKEYPKEMRDVLTLYAEGYALADLLVQEGGKAKYLRFLDDANSRGWDFALGKHYTYKSVEQLERRWSDWVIAGSPQVTPPGQILAANTPASTTRAQSAPLNTPRVTSAASARPMSEPVLGESVAFADVPDEFQSRSEPQSQASAGKLDRSLLSRPVHQVPVTSAMAPSSYEAFYCPIAGDRVQIESQKSATASFTSASESSTARLHSRLWIFGRFPSLPPARWLYFVLNSLS